MASPRAKDLRRKKFIFGLISTLMWGGTVLVFAILAFTKFKAKDSSGMPIFSEQLKSLIVSIGVTAIVGLIVSIIIKDKIRTFVFMASAVLGLYLYDATGMYIVLGIWLVDEYIIHSLYKMYSRKYEIRKEIDLE